MSNETLDEYERVDESEVCDEMSMRSVTRRADSRERLETRVSSSRH
jgi:hypothetical protein